MTRLFVEARYRGACFALIVAGLTAASPLAHAQDATSQTITVTAPRRIERSPATGASIDLVQTSRKVSFGDLNLRTESGLAELDRRIAEAGRDACGDLQTRYPLGSPDAFTCAKDARASAQSQIEALKALALQGVKTPSAATTQTYASPASAEVPAPRRAP